MDKYAPIVLFVYSRAKHTKRCIDSLLKSPIAANSTLFVFSDGAKGTKDAKDVAEVREYIASITGFKNVIIEEREKNIGLADSVIYGVTKVLYKYDKVIVLEDDLIVMPAFLSYMNDALDIYQNVDEVVNINSHVLTGPLSFQDNFLVSFADSWGWATWSRGWKLFEPDGNKLFKKIKEQNLCKKFDMGYHFSRMLKEHNEGKIDSWAIRWNASIFASGKLSLNADKPLTINGGFGNGATHCNTPDLFSVRPFFGDLSPELISPLKESRLSRLKLAVNYILRTSYCNKLRVWLSEKIKK